MELPASIAQHVTSKDQLNELLQQQEEVNHNHVVGAYQCYHKLEPTIAIMAARQGLLSKDIDIQEPRLCHVEHQGSLHRLQTQQVRHYFHLLH